MSIFSAVLGGIGIVSSIFGAKKQASAQKSAAQANAAIAAKNAEFSQENEYDVLLQGRQLEWDKYRQINRAIGSTRAAVAGAGLVVDDTPGTLSSDLVEDMRVVGAMDIQRIRENVRLEARKFQQQTEDYKLREKFGLESARSISPTLAGLTAGLSAGTSAYQAGLFDSFIGFGN